MSDNMAMPHEKSAPASTQPAPEPAPPRIAAASVLLVRGDEVLLVRRAKGGNAGLWSAPGGHITPGESALEAARRELLEETGIIAPDLQPLATHIVPLQAAEDSLARTYEITVFTGIAPADAVPRAGSDAADARFMSPARLAVCPKTDGLDQLVDLARTVLTGTLSAPPR
jgi:8-oxo-dGTP diphosphatase